jgi:hypothetical protein
VTKALGYAARVEVIEPVGLEVQMWIRHGVGEVAL